MLEIVIWVILCKLIDFFGFLCVYGIVGRIKRNKVFMKECLVYNK